MNARYLLIIALFYIPNIVAQDISVVPDSLKNKDFDYLFDNIERNNTLEKDRALYLRVFVVKAKSEENWEELSNAYKNYVHYAPEKLKLVFADSMVAAAQKSKDNRIIGSAYLSKGIAYYSQKRLKEAMDLYLIADKYITKTNDRDLIRKSKYQIGQIKYYLGYYDEAILIFKECIDYYKPSNVRAYLNSLHLLGLCYNMVGNHGLCTSINEAGIAEGKRTGNLDMESYFVHSEGVNQCMMHNYTLAIQKIRLSMPHIQKNKDFANETIGYFYIGKSLWELGEKEQALPYFKMVDKAFSQRYYIRPDLSESYELLISYYNSKNMLGPQLHYIEKLIQVNKKLSHTYAYLQEKVLGEYNITGLAAEKEKIEKALNRQKYNDCIFISIIAIMTIFTSYWIVRYFRSRKEARKKYEELVAKIEAARKVKSNDGEDANIQMSKDAETTVLQSLKKFEKGKKFLEKDLNLTKLAGNFNTNTKYLSHIILRHRNKKFPEYINGLKIDSIAERIRNEKVFRNYTHDALADEAGFSSTRRFVNAFFSRTGITVTYFIDELKKEKE